MVLTLKDLWDYDEVDSDSYSHKILQHKFMARQTSEVITAEKHFLLKDTSHLDVADEIAKNLGGHPISGDNENYYVIHGEFKGHPTLVYITQGSKSRHSPAAYDHDEGDILGLRVSRIKVDITAHRQAIKDLMAHLVSFFKETKISSVRWWFQGDHGPGNREMFMEPLTTTLHHEFYPTIKGNTSEYLERYLRSEASILLLAGVPGTGKTTLLRHLICDFNLAADIIYDETLMNKDTLFQDFLFSKSQIMLLEDADSILNPREEFNPLMSRFLNVSEGLIKLPEKKLVFTTNLTDFRRVDAALTRPGRCFDVIETRALTYQEACAAAETAKIEASLVEGKSYTLAELFHNKATITPRKLGF